MSRGRLSQLLLSFWAHVKYLHVTSYRYIINTVTINTINIQVFRALHKSDVSSIPLQAVWKLLQLNSFLNTILNTHYYEMSMPGYILSLSVCLSTYLCVIKFSPQENYFSTKKWKKEKKTMDLYKSHTKHSLDITLEMLNFWCRTHSTWLTSSHLSFNHIILTVDLGNW